MSDLRAEIEQEDGPQAEQDGEQGADGRSDNGAQLDGKAPGGHDHPAVLLVAHVADENVGPGGPDGDADAADELENQELEVALR